MYLSVIYIYIYIYILFKNHKNGELYMGLVWHDTIQLCMAQNKRKREKRSNIWISKHLLNKVIYRMHTSAWTWLFLEYKYKCLELGENHHTVMIERDSNLQGRHRDSNPGGWPKFFIWGFLKLKYQH